jgi:hypothetical protein
MPSNVTVVNLIPKSLSGETNPDSEPNLAVNPANPQIIAASAFTPNPAGSGDAPIFLSTDGGNTWSLQAIVPSDAMTADITLRFGTSSNNLYAGIIRTPIAENAPTRLNILRTSNVSSGAPMDVLVDRTGQGVDQPFIQAATIPDGRGGTADVVICGDNDFNNQPQSATMDVSGNAGAAPAPFSNSVVDVRPGGNGDAPSIRPAIHSDGTVYGAFLRRISGTTNNNLRYDVVVVRDDKFASGAHPFTALTDPADGLVGTRVAQNRLIPFLNQPVFGQERIGSSLSICIDPREGQSNIVFLAWADRVGTTDYTIHLGMSDNRGKTWSDPDLLTITNATNPAVAINANGVVGFVYQQLTGPFKPNKVSAANRWVTHFQTSNDGGKTWNDLVLATTPANLPPNNPPNVSLPYLGDYLYLMTVGNDFYGVFSANNTPDPANFPSGVVFQRNIDKTSKTLRDVDGVTPVDVSIDPFFFKVSP